MIVGLARASRAGDQRLTHSMPAVKEATDGYAETLCCNVLAHNVVLRTSPYLFRPTLTTTILTEQLDDASVRNRTVLDLGCGIGPIAIGLALSGAAHVYAADIMPEACELAKDNAALNHVAERITFVHGNLFEPLGDLRFDLIVDDVSAVSEDVARLSRWFPRSVSSGGEDGTVNTIEMLRASPRHLNPGGFLLFPVLSLSRQQRILEVAHEVYGERLVLAASRRIPFSGDLKNNLARLEQLRSKGLIEFWHVRNRPYWVLEIYKAYAGSAPPSFDDRAEAGYERSEV
jgi:SAM-dependent methyltransferase